MVNYQANVNDNYSTHQLYQGEFDCLPYREAAIYLIQKYSSAFWKNDRNDIDYIYMELMLCRHLKMETPCKVTRKLKIKWIAQEIGINPLLLYNDEKLPF